jgi:hypothetical protein
MHDPGVFWLVLLNVLLGVAVLLLVVLITGGVLCEFVGAWKKRRAAIRGLDEEMRDLMHGHESPPGRRGR